MPCGITLKTDKRTSTEHECGESLCNICQQYYDGDYHQCYLRSIEPEDKNDKFIFYDFECQQDNEKKQHIPNYVVSQSSCNECEEENVIPTAKCYNCGSRCNMCNQYNKEFKEYERMPSVVGLDRRYSVVPVQRKISVNGYSLKHTKVSQSLLTMQEDMMHTSCMII